MSATAIAERAKTPPATTTQQQTIPRTFMPTTPIIESLSHALDHWQFLYILAITVALLSTFAIVVFAFHIQEHKTGLKISNYIYVFASVLAVVSTIVIVVKTKSLDAEKDRVAGIEIQNAKTSAATATATAETARGKAEEARRKAEEARKNAELAREKAESIQAKAEEARKNSLKAERDAQASVIDKEKILRDNLELQRQLEDERTARMRDELRAAPRNLTGYAQQQMIAQLRPILPQTVDLILYPGNPESDNLAHQIAYVFQKLHWEFHFAQPMGGSVQGVRIEFDGQDRAVTNAAAIIKSFLQLSGIQVTADVSRLMPFGQEMGVYTSDGEAGNGKLRIFVGSKP